MFWNKAKQTLRDKEAGLVFNWRNPFPLKYPLLGFLFLSLLAHFFFLQLFRFPENAESQGALHTATILLLTDDGDPAMQRLLAKAIDISIATPRGPADIDPLAKGIDDQLYQPLSAGAFDWVPKARPYPDAPFEEPGATDLSWKKAVPPVDLTYQATTTARAFAKNTLVLPRFTSIEKELKDHLGPDLPKWKAPPSLIGEKVKFMVSITRDGKLFMATPLDKNGTSEEAYKLAERWLHNLPWRPSPAGVKGIVYIEWEEAENV